MSAAPAPDGTPPAGRCQVYFFWFCAAAAAPFMNSPF